MGYQSTKSLPSYEAATHVCIEIDAKDADYIDSIQRRLIGRILAQGDRIKLHMHGKQIVARIVQVKGERDDVQLKKAMRDVTHFEFVKARPTSSALGVDEEKDVFIVGLTDMIRSSFENSEAYRKLGIPVAKSILIHGVSGVGKTRLVKRVAELLGSTVYTLSIHDLLVFEEEEYNQSEFANYNPFTLILNEASKNKPSIVVLRDLNALSTGEKSNQVLKVVSKGINSLGDQVCVVGLAQNLNTLPEALRKTDIFRQHMTLPIPTMPQRKVIIRTYLNELNLKNLNHVPDVVDYYSTQISMRTSGYVANDLKLLVRQAKLKAMRSTPDIAEQLEQLSLTDVPEPCVQWSDFEYALDTYRPSQRTEVESSIPKRDWEDLGGYQAIKDRMKQAVLLPLLQPQVFTKLGIKPPSGLLLYGPSGCGKTALVQALVSESMTNVISIKGPEIFSKYLGETEQKLRKLFATAKRIAPCIVFIDEMDAIGTKRGFDMGDSSGGVNERVLSTLLNEMDGVEGRQGVVVIGCTNRPDQIDDAILRPGRLDQLVYVGLPTLEDRVDIIRRLKEKTRTEDIDPVALATQTEFCSGADLENLFREAGTAALRNNLDADCISQKDIESVIVQICEKAEDQVLEGKLDLYERFLHDHSV